MFAKCSLCLWTKLTIAWLSTKLFFPSFRFRQVKTSNRVRLDHRGNHVGAAIGFVSAAEETPAESPNHSHPRALVLCDGTGTSSSSCPLRVDYSRALVLYGDAGTAVLSCLPRVDRRAELIIIVCYWAALGALRCFLFSASSGET